MTFVLADHLEVCRRWVDLCLKECLNSLSCPSPLLHEAMSHSLMAGGKRLRPILCLGAAQAISENLEQAMELCQDVACALELIHTYSLIHDDLPAMDDDDLRRGIPTCHKAFDEGTAILAGDALLTLAFDCLASSQKSVLHPGLWLNIIRAIAKAAGPAGMVGGQMLDLVSEGKNIDYVMLERLHRLKTGALIEVSIYCGALLAGADDKQQVALSVYGSHLGLAFQVTDDLLDVTGDPAVMGKAAGSDAQSGKATYPSLLGVEAATELAESLVKNAIDSLDDFGHGADPLRSLAAYVLERKK
ncbi:polyprenyl synthetase family protein [Desulfobotulus mexicanus]|uniref:Polyprenyl synthetase family protein n=1 Tax=Desulfobotulus mexicanus TaxID=2586642 RepID=A0A5Q4VCF4_9BACT|nr:farnesyl diphosphate synthase [Desulfobotulus mexicanus]TYT75384.1 polyprenyl synthetase family protein [Desulfobotulus mexicanus]